MKFFYFFLMLILSTKVSNSQDWLNKLETVVKGVGYYKMNEASNNTLSRLTGKWTKSKILYPNGRMELVPSNERISITIFPDLNDQTLMGYQIFRPNEDFPYEKGVVWLRRDNSICFGANFNPSDYGLTFKFGKDNRGLESLMIKALMLSNEEVWLIYQREI